MFKSKPLVDSRYAKLRGRTEFFRIESVHLKSNQVTVKEKKNVWNTVDFSFVEAWK